MEEFSELLMRSTLHDMANVLAGVKGIVDLNPPDQPISPRDRQRLEAVLEEGISTLERCRHLTMATLPEAAMEPGADWREQLLEELKPLGTLFRSQFALAFEGAPEWDQWAGRLHRSYIRAVTRQVMPFAKGTVMSIRCGADPDGWRVQWSPAPGMPDNLVPGADVDHMDICGRWALQAGAALASSLTCEGGSLLLRIPRQGVGQGR
jgi:hypothetical protein